MRPLNPDEAALWARVVATVRPLRAAPRAAPPPPKAPPPPPPPPAASPKPVKAAGRVPPMRAAPAITPSAKPRPNTLDGGWDKKLGRGIVIPDSSIDLHGHSLASAHALLDQGLDRAIARGDRVLLLVTGKPPRPESERPHARGAIRAAIADWLAASRHADAIAAVRGAHPRHGGAGALYIVLRRGR
ncbi:Smr/MutS family protein [Sphingomonas sp.]|uniref:Smr/MutS family protein n=1 Tax=Sphingomonas sp. TaxID=28214 RepID=UPI00258E4B15|nr:Smr/MutS family protein [Sphingomonas sp.]